MIYIYRPLYILAKFLILIFRFLLPDHLKNWLDRRNVDFNLMVPLKAKSIWFHASSGEVEYVKNIITEIKKSNPNQKIALTYSSPSIEKLLTNIKDQLDVVIPLPWDQPQAIKQLITMINPATLVFAKTDFWPELLHQAHAAKIRCGVVSFSLNMKVAPSFLQRWVFKNLSFIFVSDHSTQERLRFCKITSVVASDTRFDQVFFRLQQPSKFNYSFKKPVFTFGSTWPQDDAVLLEVAPSLIKQGLQIAWCPHDAGSENIHSLKEKLANFNHRLYSSLTTVPDIDNDILIIDQVGVLADIYRQSEFAFIGGSFKEKIHSVMEALCAGNIVFFGPYYQNNSEAIEFLGLNLAFQFNSASQFLEQFQSLTPNSKTEKQLKINELAQSKKGSSKKIAEYLLT